MIAIDPVHGHHAINRGQATDHLSCQKQDDPGIAPAMEHDLVIDQTGLGMERGRLGIVPVTVHDHQETDRETVRDHQATDRETATDLAMERGHQETDRATERDPLAIDLPGQDHLEYDLLANVLPGQDHLVIARPGNDHLATVHLGGVHLHQLIFQITVIRTGDRAGVGATVATGGSGRLPLLWEVG